LAWTAGLDVPSAGFVTSLSADELAANLDPKGKK